MGFLDSSQSRQHQGNITLTEKVCCSQWKINFIYLIVIMLCVSMAQCSKKENAPYFDGLYFEYDVTITYKTRDEAMLKMEGTKERLKVKYKVEVFDDKYKVTKTSSNANTDRVINEEVYNVDASGKAEELGNYLKIWLPVTGLDAGETLYGTFKVDRKERWKTWDVAVLIDKMAPIGEWYYDVNTGFLVGIKSGLGSMISGSQEREEVLIDTNADINVSGE